MFNWIRNFARKMQVAGLNVLKGILYLICAPIVVVFMLYGCYFVIAAFLWVVLVDAAFVTLVLVFCANFFMFFVALFNPSVWATMGAMWSWLWSWFAGGNVALWPHFVRSFPLYMISGIALMLLYEGIKRLKVKATAIKAQFA